MRTNIFIVFLGFLVIRCGSDPANQKVENMEEASGNVEEKTSEVQNPKDKFWTPIVMHEVKDQHGVVAKSYPLPENWSINDPKYLAVGPNNIKVTPFPLQSFTKNLDPGMEYIYSQTPQRSMPEIGQLIQEDVLPWTQKNGYEIIKHYDLPDVGKMDAWYSDQLYKVSPSQSTVRAYGIDLRNQNGNPALLILHLNHTIGSGLEMWNYYVELLESDPGFFELARKQYLFALANVRYNLEPIMAYNKKEMERIGENWAAFNNRMAENQRAFEANQRTHINKTNAINDAIMAGWKSSNETSDRIQEQNIDAVYNRQTVQNPETGQTTKLDDGYGYNRYWMNTNGDYIATEHQTYDPNLDKNLNEKNWQELNVIK